MRRFRRQGRYRKECWIETFSRGWKHFPVPVEVQQRPKSDRIPKRKKDKGNARKQRGQNKDLHLGQRSPLRADPRGVLSRAERSRQADRPDAVHDLIPQKRRGRLGSR